VVFSFRIQEYQSKTMALMGLPGINQRLENYSLNPKSGLPPVFVKKKKKIG
jgi:hypothetical protein